MESESFGVNLVESESFGVESESELESNVESTAHWLNLLKLQHTG